MDSGNVISLSNFAESSNINIEKKMYNKAGMANFNICTFFAGTMVLRCPVEGKVVSQYGFSMPSYIKCIHLDQEKGFEGLYFNKTIDLTKVENLNKIKKMALFDDDWNGTGGNAFSEGAINLFDTIIRMLEKQPQIAPTGRNSLLMQYESEDKSLLAFEVSEKKTEKVYIPKGNYSLAQVDVFTDNVVQQINESVERFYGPEKN